jgi:hypothetical protein
MSQRCEYTEVWTSRDDDKNAFGDFFRDSVANFPIAGGLFAGMVPDTLTSNAVRSCPGATIDKTSGYTLDLILLGLIVFLIVVYLSIKK